MSIVIESGYTGTLEPLTHPRVCYQKHTATVTATSSASGADPQWVADGETWSVWVADVASATLTLDFGATAQTIDYAGLAATNLETSQTTVAVEAQLTDGGAWTEVASALAPLGSPNSDNALLFLLDPRDVFGVRFVFTGGSAPAQVGVAQAGLALEFPRRCQYTGSTAITETERVSYRELQSLQGDVISRTTQGSEYEFSMQLDHLAEIFRSATGVPSWPNLIRHHNDAAPGTFFIATNPEDFPEQLSYARFTERPRISRSLGKNSVAGSVTMNCKGYRKP